MFDAGIKARYMMRGRYFPLFFESILPVFLRLCAAVLAAVPVSAAVFGTELTGNIPIWGTASLCVVCVFGAIFLFLFSVLRDMLFRVRLYDLLCLEAPAVEGFYNIKRLMGFLKYRLFLTVLKLYWAALFFLPCGTLAFILYFAFAVNGNMLKNTFYALIAALVLFIAVGSYFYIVTADRYFLCDFLYCRNPLQPIRELISASVSATRGQLTELFFKRVRMLPWKIFGFLLIPLPFTRIYTRCLGMVLAEEYFCEKKYFAGFERTDNTKSKTRYSF